MILVEGIKTKATKAEALAANTGGGASGGGIH